MDEYQQLAVAVCGRAIDWSMFSDAYYGLGVAGEAAETTDKLLAILLQAFEGLQMGSNAGLIADRIKKTIRPDAAPIDRHALAAELGDQLWYVARTAAFYEFSLSDIARMNLAKLTGRATRGTVIRGEGDKR